MTFVFSDRVKQGGLIGGGIVALLFPQALPVLLGLALLIQMAAAGGPKAVPTFGAWHRLRPALLLFLLPALALMLAPWAEWPGPAAARAGRLIGEILLALALAGHLLTVPPERAAARGRALCYGIGLGAALAIVDLLGGGVLTGTLRGQPVDAITYGRSAVLAALAVVPMLIAAPLPVVQRVAVALPGIVLALLSANLAAKLLLPAAAVAALIGLWRWGPLLVAIGIAGMVALPGVLPVALTPAQECSLWLGKPSAAHRLLIWTYADGLIAERPWTGWGLDAARRLGAAAPEAPVPDCARPSLGRDTVPLLPLHPHNGALQLWLELGAGGAMALPILLLAAAGSFAARSRSARTLAAAALAGAAVPVFVSFGLWQGWWLAGLSIFWGLNLLFLSSRS